MTPTAALRRVETHRCEWPEGCPVTTPQPRCTFHTRAAQPDLGLKFETLPDMLRRLATVRRPCACGLVIVAETNLPLDVLAAVQGHNRKPEHQAYSARLGAAA